MSDTGGEDAVFPSGGEDISLVLKWAQSFDPAAKRDIFIMGNSAGGVHLSTFLLSPEFLAQRRNLLSGKSPITWKGNILLSVPFEFPSLSSGRWDMVTRYYGSVSRVGENCPFGLLERIRMSGKSREETYVPNTIALAGEYDPVDDILKPGHHFVALYNEIWKSGLELSILDGHNHFSPVLALLSGDTVGEQWASEIIKWIQTQDSEWEKA